MMHRNMRGRASVWKYGSRVACPPPTVDILDVPTLPTFPEKMERKATECRFWQFRFNRNVILDIFIAAVTTATQFISL
ncbi:hypothetical protein V6U71_09000 [Sphingopyxis sp. J-6]|uniref:hypothetical protein n=1 Tax=Sphingopyxis sp. J-6 TaxID=3122054 RepID=UPI00398419C1